jgi:hypothetical protein
MELVLGNVARISYSSLPAGFNEIPGVLSLALEERPDAIEEPSSAEPHTDQRRPFYG